MNSRKVSDTIKEMAGQGMSITEIMKATGRSRCSVATCLGKCRDRGEAAAQRAAVERMLREGVRMADIAARANVRLEYVWRCHERLMAKNDGVDERPAPERPSWVWPIAYQVRWVQYVNVIRRHYGMELMPEPDFGKK